MTAPHGTLRVAHPVSDDEPVTFRADRARLQGRLFRPGAPPRAAIVLHGATGVPQRYYRAFATWLAEQGYACLTYDYRDFGASAVGHVRVSNATMSDWGLRDQAAAQAALEAQVPDAPIWVIGHSLGGLMLPFHPGAARVSRLITVASGPVYSSDHPGMARVAAAAFWSPATRAAVRALGFVPGKLFGLGADLPRGVYTEWRRWCTTRGFYLGDIGQSLPMPDWAAMQGEMKAVAVADDGLVPPAAVWRLMQHYPEARKTQLTLRPGDHGLDRIGHIKVFSRKNSVLWPQILT